MIMAICSGMRFGSSVLIVVMLFILVVASSALGLETICDGELERGIAISILESSRARDIVGVFLAVELVTQRKVYGPFHSDIDSLASLVFDTNTQRHIGRKDAAFVGLTI